MEGYGEFREHKRDIENGIESEINLRIMGIDFGTKRIGVAISDELLITAQGMESIVTAGSDKDLAKIAGIAAEYKAEEIIVGLPLNMDGTESKKTRETIAFLEKLRRVVSIPVKTWDERLTSIQADRAMLEADLSRKRRKELSDRVAAQLILQGYLDSKRPKGDYD